MKLEEEACFVSDKKASHSTVVTLSVQDWLELWWGEKKLRSSCQHHNCCHFTSWRLLSSQQDLTPLNCREVMAQWVKGLRIHEVPTAGIDHFSHQTTHITYLRDYNGHHRRLKSLFFTKCKVGKVGYTNSSLPNANSFQIFKHWWLKVLHAKFTWVCHMMAPLSYSIIRRSLPCTWAIRCERCFSNAVDTELYAVSLHKGQVSQLHLSSNLNIRSQSVSDLVTAMFNT